MPDNRHHLVVLRPDCDHYRECGVSGGGCCGLNLYGGRPSHGVCNRCEHNRSKGQMPMIAGPVDPLAGIPLPGDVLESVLKRIGADRLAKWWERVTGQPCGCGERKEKINAAAARLMRWFGRQ